MQLDRRITRRTTTRGTTKEWSKLHKEWSKLQLTCALGRNCLASRHHSRAPASVLRMERGDTDKTRLSVLTLAGYETKSRTDVRNQRTSATTHAEVPAAAVARQQAHRGITSSRALACKPGPTCACSIRALHRLRLVAATLPSRTLGLR